MSEPVELSSGRGESPGVTHRIHNLRSTAVTLHWIDYDGRAAQYGTIQPGSSLDQATWAAHAWRVCDESSGAVLLEYTGPAVVAALQADGSVRIAASGAPAVAAVAGAEPGGGGVQGPQG